jgi:DsbC/DsbD-like thiol-disulfide interchange protein
LFAQGSGHLSVGAPSKIVGKRNAAVQTSIPVTVDAGYHVNSNKPPADYLIPLKLTWTSTGALQGGEVDFPKPTTIKVADQDLSVLTGSFNLVAKFKVSAAAAAGPGVVTGKLSYQACNDTTCFPPKKADVTVSYQIQ